MKTLIAFLISLPLWAQVDFPNPIRSGGTLPATCRPGSLVPALFVLTSGTPVTSAQTYQCTAANTWTAIPTSSGGASPAGSAGDMQYNAGGGLFGATSGLTWDATISRLTTNQTYTDVTLQPKTLFSRTVLHDTTDEFTLIYGGISSLLLIGDGSGNLTGSVWAGSSIIDNENSLLGKTTTHAFSHDFEVDTFGGETTTEMGGVEVTFFVGAPITSLYGSWIQAPVLQGATPTNLYGYYASDFSGTAANPYYSWFDSRGVGRCREDSTFDSVGQSICSVYNPQFAKYTPGASDYERIIYGQWNGNVAEIGAEKGGSGTLRGVKIIGATLAVPVTTGAATGKHVLCVDNASKIIYESSTGTDCSN